MAWLDDWRKRVQITIDHDSIGYDGQTGSFLRARFPAYHYVGTYDRTYFVYNSREYTGSGYGAIYINYYDHDTSSFGNPVEIANGISYQAHVEPTVHVIPSGTYAGQILVAFADDNHGGPPASKCLGEVYMSDSDEDISSWSSSKSLDTAGTRYNYLQLVHVDTNTEALFYKKNTLATPISEICYIKTTDGGASWSAETTVASFGANHNLYPVVASDGTEVHLAWADFTGGGYYGVYYAYSPDNLASWRTQSSAVPIVLPIDSLECETVEAAGANENWVCDIQLDGSNSPKITYTIEVNATTASAYYAEYSGAAWNTHDTGVDILVYGTGASTQAYNTGIFIDPADIGHVFIGTRESATTSQIEEWHTTDGGMTWVKIQDISAADSRYDQARPAVNYDSTCKLYYNRITGWAGSDGWAANAIVNGTVIQNDLEDFPVLLHLSSSCGQNNDDVTFIFDEIGANKLKIAITTDDEVTECYGEIEEWDNVGEEAWIWVKIPTLRYDIDTIIYFYFDNNHANNTSYIGEPNDVVSENVWDSHFLLVSHMLDDPDTSHTRDSTSNDNDGTKKAAATPTVNTGGKVSDCQSFASGDYIDLVSAFNSDYLTVEALIKGSATADQSIIHNCTIATSKFGWSFYIEGTGDIVALRVYKTDADSNLLEGTTDVTDGAWHGIAGSYDGGRHSVYVDGESENIAEYTGTIQHDADAARVGLFTNGNNPFIGLMDEVRVSDIGRSEAWIRATYNTSIDNLLDWGIEENKSATRGWWSK